MWALTDLILSGALVASVSALIRHLRRQAGRRDVNDYLDWLLSDTRTWERS